MLTTIYTIIRHKSKDSLSTFANCGSQFLFDRLGRCLKLLPRYILSRVRVSVRLRIFLYAKKRQTTVARPAAVDHRCAADKQLNWAAGQLSAKSSARRRCCGVQRSGFKPRAGNNIFSLLLFVINKAHF